MKIEKCFNILKLNQNATLDEARKAYKAEVVRWHPDKYHDQPALQESALEKIKTINLAYEQVVNIIKNRSDRPFRQNIKSSGQQKAPSSNTESLTNYLSFLDDVVAKIYGIIKKNLFTISKNQDSNAVQKPKRPEFKVFKDVLKETVKQQNRYRRENVSAESLKRKKTNINGLKRNHTSAKKGRSVGTTQSIRPVSKIKPIGDD